MRRVISIWLPSLATDRLRPAPDGRRRPEQPVLWRRCASWGDHAPGDAAPLITRAHDGRRLVVAAACEAARALGLVPGLPLAQAHAMVPGLAVADADPQGDAEAVLRLAAWCLRWTPLAAPDAPDGLWLDATGCAWLHEAATARGGRPGRRAAADPSPSGDEANGEAAMLSAIARLLAREGIAARLAIADTPGAAHALARHGTGGVLLAPPGRAGPLLDQLPVAALRLEPGLLAGLRGMGLERIGALLEAPRGPLVRRFGPALALRLDQLGGAVFEPILPVCAPGPVQHRLGFVEPLLAAEQLAAVIARLVPEVCAALARAGQGARRLALVFERVDGTTAVLRVGTALASRDARHLERLLVERLEAVDPGLGVEAMRLVVVRAEPLAAAQAEVALEGAGEVPSRSRRTSRVPSAEAVGLATLVDRLENRLGPGRVWRAEPAQSDVPERSVRAVPPLSPPLGLAWPRHLPRPARLIDPPQPVLATAMLPDHPPRAFTWRRVQHRVRHADGPERIGGEWWMRDGERDAVRDYWTVEDEAGQRFWLYRRGDGTPATGDLRWFLHGVF